MKNREFSLLCNNRSKLQAAFRLKDILGQQSGKAEKRRIKRDRGKKLRLIAAVWWL